MTAPTTPSEPTPDTPHPPPSPRRRLPARRSIVLGLAVATSAAAGAVVGRSTAPTASRPAASAPSASTAAPVGATRRGSSGCPGADKVPAMGNMSSPDASLGQFIGRQAGTAMAGNAPIAVTGADLRALGDQAPAGAQVDRCADRIMFSTSSVSFVIEASPANNPDMTFRLAGLVNPTVVVRRGARVSIEFVNADTDEAHAFVITATAGPYPLRPAADPAFPGAAAGPVGDPTSAGSGARALDFTASAVGTYHYLCPMPGHAEMGMNGLFEVQ